jgi:hypothetical protein
MKFTHGDRVVATQPVGRGAVEPGRRGEVIRAEPSLLLPNHYTVKFEEDLKHSEVIVEGLTISDLAPLRERELYLEAENELEPDRGLEVER